MNLNILFHLTAELPFVINAETFWQKTQNFLLRDCHTNVTVINIVL
jgi:hypothetical protein